MVCWCELDVIKDCESNTIGTVFESQSSFYKCVVGVWIILAETRGYVSYLAEGLSINIGSAGSWGAREKFSVFGCMCEFFGGLFLILLVKYSDVLSVFEAIK